MSALLEQTAVELEKRQEGRSGTQTLQDSWRFEEETSENEAAAEEEEGEEDIFSEKSSPEMDECPAVKVDKETNTETPAPSPTVVRPKDRRVGMPSPGPFLRGSTIIRSKTFSPGPQSQYVCRVSKRYVVLSFSQRACFPQGSQEPSASHSSGYKSPLLSPCQVTSGKVTPLSLSFLTWS